MALKNKDMASSSSFLQILHFYLFQICLLDQVLYNLLRDTKGNWKGEGGEERRQPHMRN